MFDISDLTTTKQECMSIALIANRAHHLGVDRSKRDLIMDLEVAHHSCPMDLDGLHNAADHDLIHDVCGIVHHLNRATGKLEDYFSPRYAV